MDRNNFRRGAAHRGDVTLLAPPGGHAAAFHSLTLGPRQRAAGDRGERGEPVFRSDFGGRGGTRSFSKTRPKAQSRCGDPFPAGDTRWESHCYIREVCSLIGWLRLLMWLTWRGWTPPRLVQENACEQLQVFVFELPGKSWSVAASPNSVSLQDGKQF